MKKLASVVLLLVLCFFLVGFLDGPIYKGVIHNRSSKIVDVVIVELTNAGGEYVSGKMLSPNEKWEVGLPPGKYIIVGSCSKGYYQLEFELPGSLESPDQEWGVDFWDHPVREI